LLAFPAPDGAIPAKEDTLALFAWASLAFVAFVTLSPIGLRPVVLQPGYEHFLAFAIIGLLFGIAYPRHWLLIGLAVIGSAVALEFLQLIAPGRHARLLDLMQKIAGGFIGLTVATLIAAKKPRR
jgi:hypothetical protein